MHLLYQWYQDLKSMLKMPINIFKMGESSGSPHTETDELIPVSPEETMEEAIE